jgi:hypothetical protein
MTHDLICTWLGLPAGTWPPDHYILLGLKPGENDQNLIEERVHQRLDTVRRYQMIHSDEATEAMNRIAQAFVCLSEPASKRVYDGELLGPAAVAAAPPAEPAAAEPLVLVYNPVEAEAAPPVRRVPQPPPLPGAEEVPVAVLVPDVLPVEPPPLPVPEVVEAPARGLAGRRALYKRLARTRRLIDQWNDAGMFLASPKRPLKRAAEINELLRRLNDIQEGLHAYSPLLGAAGQPGNQVLALTQLPPQQFLTLTPPQREALTADWQAGQAALDNHLAALRDEVHATRRRSLGHRLGRSIRGYVTEKPGVLIVVLALLALNIAIFRTYVMGWVEALLFP